MILNFDGIGEEVRESGDEMGWDEEVYEYMVRTYT